MATAESLAPQQSRPVFTLVDFGLLMVALFLAAAVTVPRLRDSVERAKARAAFDYLEAVSAAQERHHSRTGAYADDVAALGLARPLPAHFVAAAVVAPQGRSLREGWQITLWRVAPAADHPPYTIIFTERGFDAGRSTIADGDHRAIDPGS